MAEQTSKPDGTARLCTALYGREDVKAMLGGSDAKMLHDAADEIERLRRELADIDDVYKATMAEVCRDGPELEKHCTCVPWLRKGIKDRDGEIKRLIAERDRLLGKLRCLVERLNNAEAERDRLRKYNAGLAEAVERNARELREERVLRSAYCASLQALTDAVDRGGFTLTQCVSCGRPVIAIDSGEGGLCRKCAESNQ